MFTFIIVVRQVVINISVVPFHIDISQTSLILPEMFQEKYIRVFAKRTEQVISL